MQKSTWNAESAKSLIGNHRRQNYYIRLKVQNQIPFNNVENHCKTPKKHIKNSKITAEISNKLYWNEDKIHNIVLKV